tara:strand:- start:20279 stop:21097 length:819 start_codon:yes stop_codon:yes gene_type:complete
MLSKVKQFDERHLSSRSDVTPLEETGIKVNEKSILAWQKYNKDYESLKAEENTGEGEVFMRPMPSFLKYLEKQNFVEKQERKLKIGTYSGNSTLKRLHIEEEQDVAPPTLEMDRVKIDSFSDVEEEEVDLNDAFLDKKVEVQAFEKEYKTRRFLEAVKLHTEDMDASKKALWNDCVIFLPNVEKQSYSVSYLRNHAFPDKTHIVDKLARWKRCMNTLGQQRLAHDMVISNLIGKEFKISNIPYKLQQVDELQQMNRKSGAYVISLVGTRGLI